MHVVVHVFDAFQKNYTYVRSCAPGKFSHKDFAPMLTPKEMLSLGVFGGLYMTDCAKEFPEDWFANAKLSPQRRNCRLNFFGVCSGQPLRVWEENGWIHKDDPRGWFQWYCRYYMGRRHEDDERQIKRWIAFRRHATQLTNACEPSDTRCRPRQRQALLQWAYDSRRM